MNDDKSDRSKRGKVAAVVASALGIGAVTAFASGSVASWTDTESARTEMDSGIFNLQISTDERQTWQDGTSVNDNSHAELALEGFDPELGYIDTDFSLRLSPDSTHDAVISADSIENIFSVSPEIAGEYGFYIYDENLLVEGVVDPDSPTSADGEVGLEAGDLVGEDFTLVVYPLSYVSEALVGGTDTVRWDITAESGEADSDQVFVEPEFEMPELGEHTRFVDE